MKNIKREGFAFPPSFQPTVPQDMVDILWTNELMLQGKGFPWTTHTTVLPT
jgi:hypothetical protein